MSREWVINAYEGYDALQLQACEPQTPAASEIRLRVEAFSLNWGDNDLMHNRYSFSFSGFPARIGMEACGIVEAVGADVSGIALGDRYCTLPYFYDRQGARPIFQLLNLQRQRLVATSSCPLEPARLALLHCKSVLCTAPR